jgi:hypothetical protein
MRKWSRSSFKCIIKKRVHYFLRHLSKTSWKKTKKNSSSCKNHCIWRLCRCLNFEGTVGTCWGAAFCGVIQRGLEFGLYCKFVTQWCGKEKKSKELAFFGPLRWFLNYSLAFSERRYCSRLYGVLSSTLNTPFGLHNSAPSTSFQVSTRKGSK